MKIVQIGVVLGMGELVEDIGIGKIVEDIVIGKIAEDLTKMLETRKDYEDFKHASEKVLSIFGNQTGMTLEYIEKTLKGKLSEKDF